MCKVLYMETTETAPTHTAAARSHLERRDDLLAQARALDFRTLDRDHYNALIASAEREQSLALACAAEVS
jgi:hypothetical protein